MRYGLALAVLCLSGCTLAPLHPQVDKASPASASVQQRISPADHTTHAPTTGFRIPSAFAHTPARALKGQFSAVSWSQLPGWAQDNGEQLWSAIYRNCQGLMRPVSAGKQRPARANPQAWLGFCRAVQAQGKALSPTSAKQFIQRHLQPWQLSADGKTQGMVTGYYEPVVRGATQQGGEYQWPLYAVPSDLLHIDVGSVYPDLVGQRVRGKLQGRRIVPYDTRAQLAQRQPSLPALAWLADPVEAAFFQIQGSGRVQLPDGRLLRLQYADHNGHPYRSIGRWLADQGEMPLSQTSAQGIQRWAKANPHRIQSMLNANPAVVFFQLQSTHPNEGPSGAYGIPLTAGRSIAVDPQYMPLGSVAFLATTYPASTQPLQRVVLAQDTGSAIRGVHRSDFFWGTGVAAGKQAGRMRQQGQLWVLWPKDQGMPSAR